MDIKDFSDVSHATNYFTGIRAVELRKNGSMKKFAKESASQLDFRMT
jgi:hypothetical protein